MDRLILYKIIIIFALCSLVLVAFADNNHSLSQQTTTNNNWIVDVETKNGEVYLSGEIASANEKQALINITKSVKSIRKVNDKMTIPAKMTY